MFYRADALGCDSGTDPCPETISSADCWNEVVGCVWARMMRIHRVDPMGTVVEIGPGFADKIARGLAAIHFRGLLVLVEPNKMASAWALERYRKLLPKAHVMVVHRPMPDGKILRGRAVDALLSNHILDDFILNASIEPELGNQIFAQMRPGSPCSSAFVGIWRGLLANPEGLEEQMTLVSKDFVQYVQQIQPRMVLLNQYSSWRHKRHDLSLIYTQTLKLMRMVAVDLGANCITENVLFDTGQPLPIHWLIRTSKPGI